jgi:hypothetical protein
MNAGAAGSASGRRFAAPGLAGEAGGEGCDEARGAIVRKDDRETTPGGPTRKRGEP